MQPDPPARDVVSRDEEAGEYYEEREDDSRKPVGDYEVGGEEHYEIDERGEGQVGKQHDEEEYPKLVSLILKSCNEVDRYTTHRDIIGIKKKNFKVSCSLK